jgi:hypothetical protein
MVCPVSCLYPSILLTHAIRHWEVVYRIIWFPECNAPHVTVLQNSLHVVLEPIPSAVKLINKIQYQKLNVNVD